MAKGFAPSALTAQSLLDGDVLWWTGEDWARDIRLARVLSDEAEAEALEAQANGPTHAGTVVGGYLVPVEVIAGRPRPIARRERIRADATPTFAYGPEAVAEAA